MRCFLAVFPPPATQALAGRVIDALRRPGDGVAWVKPELLHFTLRFLGEIDEQAASRVAAAADDAVRELAAFELALGGLGAFPNARKARVLWLGLERGTEPLQALAERLERALVTRGFGAEPRRFSAHLTIGRVRHGGADWSASLVSVVPPRDDSAARFHADALACVESTLSPRGPSYRVWRRAALLPIA